MSISNVASGNIFEDFIEDHLDFIVKQQNNLTLMDQNSTYINNLRKEIKEKSQTSFSFKSMIKGDFHIFNTIKKDISIIECKNYNGNKTIDTDVYKMWKDNFFNIIPNNPIFDDFFNSSKEKTKEQAESYLCDIEFKQFIDFLLTIEYGHAYKNGIIKNKFFIRESKNNEIVLKYFSIPSNNNKISVKASISKSKYLYIRFYLENKLIYSMSSRSNKNNKFKANTSICPQSIILKEKKFHNIEECIHFILRKIKNNSNNLKIIK